MSAIAQGLSHSPVSHLRPLDAVRQSAYEQALADSRKAFASFAPDLVVVFGPDHYNGFFYNSMPPFSIGARAFGIGDYQTPAGRLDVAEDDAQTLHRHMLNAEFDAVISHEMHIDHGFTQCLVQLFDSPPAFVPVFINCVAQPLASCARAIAFGREVGRHFRAQGRRVAFIGSGGLSHDAPLPSLASAPDDEARRRIIEWRLLTPDERAVREQRTLAAADQFAAGDSPLARLNPDWDRRVMNRLAAMQWNELAALDDTAITAAAGRSAHEIRTWLAAFAALSAYGPYEIEQSVYFEAPEWIVGYGALRARVRAS